MDQSNRRRNQEHRPDQRRGSLSDALRDDIGETHNLAAEKPEKASEFLERLEGWQKEIQAPIPTEPNPQFDAEAEAEAIGKSNGREANR